MAHIPVQEYAKFTAGDLCATQQHIITVDLGHTVDDVLTKLYKFGILSAPISRYDEATKESAWVGLVDMVDLVRFLVDVCRSERSSDVTVESTSLDTDDMGLVMERMHDFSLQKLADSDVCDISRRNPFCTIAEGAPLDEALRAFSCGVHRLVVMWIDPKDKKEKPKHILTQSAVIRHFAEFQDRLKANANKTVADLGFVVDKKEAAVHTIEESATSIDAFTKMSEKNVSGLCIVSANGRAKGNISTSDLKLIRDFRFLCLLDSVSDFISNVRTEGMDRGIPVPDPLVSVAPSTTMKEVVKKMIDQKVHRVYVVDNEGYPCGVISMTDVCKLMAPK